MAIKKVVVELLLVEDDTIHNILSNLDSFSDIVQHEEILVSDREIDKLQDMADLFNDIYPNERFSRISEVILDFIKSKKFKEDLADEIYEEICNILEISHD